MIHDPNSLANINDAVTQHVSIRWTVDFSKSVISGAVTLAMVKVSAAAAALDRIVLDTRELHVTKVTVDGAAAKFELGAKSESDAKSELSTPLTVTLPTPITANGVVFKIELDYSTSPNATAVQWLTPEQTAGKKHPYLFTQCQAIHARSLLPVQDSPAVKATYDATVTVPAPLTALMSALAVGAPTEADGGTRTFSFKQPVPIPSYLIALAVGNLVSMPIGPRSAVWSEPETVAAGAYEFAETEKFIAAGEAILGPYVWQRYDLLLLPPSFPYGGMENPCLTFVTPTLLAGDRSNADVVAHEIAHSWTGNLVTNQNWEHFWLNEGWTVFIERAIVGRVNGNAKRAFSAVIGRQTLCNCVEQFGPSHPYTCLVLKLDGVDPDDSFSSIPYEKGFTFLDFLQGLVGGPSKFEPFAKAYIEKFARRGVTSQEFRSFFEAYFADNSAALKAIDWDRWFYSPGMPPIMPTLDTSLSENVTKRADEWRAFDSAPEHTVLVPHCVDDRAYSAPQLVMLLDSLSNGAPLRISTLNALDAGYGLSASRNAEVKFRWLLLAIKSQHTGVFADAVSMLTSQGRMKFTRPLYRALYKSTAGRELALATFKKHKGMYHSICAKMVEKDLSQ